MSAIDQHPPQPQELAAAPPSNPWLGLASYTEQDRNLFFGREREKAELLRLIERESLTVLFGRSGLGKTSLLRAGVTPALREATYFPVILRLDYSGKGLDPIEQLKALLQEAAQANGIDVENLPPPGLKVTLWEFFHTVECWGPRNDQLTPILIFDQFEEVFTIGRNVNATPEFLDQLADLVENRAPRVLQDRIEQTNQPLSIDAGSRNYKIVLSLREDFVSRLDSLRPLMPAIMRNRLGLDPLDGQRALSVIIHAGAEWVAEDVARDIVVAVAGRVQRSADTLPAFAPEAEIEPAYLSVMCHELFRRMLALQRNAITHDLVEHEHGGILERLYERSFEGLDPKVRTFVEDKLVSTAGFRMAVPLAEAVAEGLSDKDLDLVVDRRLLRFEDRLGTRYVELSHDLLTGVVQKSRDERRAAQLRRDLFHFRVRAALAGALALLFLSGLVFVYFAYFHEFTIYGTHFQKRFGMSEPQGLISWETVKHKEWSLKFVRKGFKPFRGEVLSVAAIDSTGHLTERHSIGTYLSSSDDESQRNKGKECQWQFVYDPEGQVTYEIARDRFDRMVWGLVYSPNSQSGGQSGTRKAMFVGPDGYPEPQGKSSAEYVEITYDPRGYEAEQRFTDREGNPAPGPDGAFGRSHEYNALGQVTKFTSLDEKGQPMNDNAGNATLVLEYDTQGNLSSATSLDRHGRLTVLKSGFVRYTYLYDKWGNVTEARFLDLKDQPATNNEVGAQIFRFKYDDRGNQTEISYYDSHGNPLEATERKFHALQIEYDNENRPIARRVFDVSMHPILAPAGFHEIHYTYDSRGFVEQELYFDEKGQPLKTPLHKKQQVNNEFGHPIEERFYNADSKPALLPSGQYHIRRSRYDERGNLVEQTYFGVDGKPVSESVSGAGKIAARYDRFSNVEWFACFGMDGATPVTCHAGFHRKEAKYDNFGHPISTKFFDVQHRPVALDGFHQITAKYDARGLLLEQWFFGTDGKPVGNRDGIHHEIFQYNDKRQRTLLQFFDVNDKPAADREALHREDQEYDDQGHKIHITQIRKDGSGFLYQMPGVVTERDKFDDQGREVEQTFCDVHDKLIVGIFGYAKVTIIRSSDGKTEYSYFGADGRSQFNRLKGYAREQEIYRNDKLVREVYYAADGSLLNGPHGYAIHTIEADSSGQAQIEKFLDQNQKPTYGPGGYSKRQSRPVGGKTEDTYFDANDQALNHPEEGVPVLYIFDILSVKAVAATIGILPGDILWRLGSWSLPGALKPAQADAKKRDQIGNLLQDSFMAAREITKKIPSHIEVVRNGRVISLPVPLLRDGIFGMNIRSRVLPRVVYEQTFSRLAASSGMH